MNDKNPSEDSDGRGVVTTGSADPRGATPASHPDPAGPGGGGTNGAGRSATGNGEAPTAQMRLPDGRSTPAAPHGQDARPGLDLRGVPGGGGPSGTGGAHTGAGPAPTGSSGPPRHADNGSAPHPQPPTADAGPSSSPWPRSGVAPHASTPQPPPSSPQPPPSREGAPSGPGWSTGPAPAPGPVPTPGPAAAALPPWHRVPGADVPEPREPGLHRPEAGQRDGGPPDAGLLGPGGLVGGSGDGTGAPLQEGPTALLPAPEGDGSGFGGQADWASVPSVRSRPPRQAALQLKRLDPWSVLKMGLVLAAVVFLIWMVAVGLLYGVLDGMGVWDRLNGTYADFAGDAATGSPLISVGRVLGAAAIVGAVNSLLFAVAVTIMSFVYNVSADLVGGMEVTLSERD